MDGVAGEADAFPGMDGEGLFPGHDLQRPPDQGDEFDGTYDVGVRAPKAARVQLHVIDGEAAALVIGKDGIIFYPALVL